MEPPLSHMGITDRGSNILIIGFFILFGLAVIFWDQVQDFLNDDSGRSGRQEVKSPAPPDSGYYCYFRDDYGRKRWYRC
jgi:hypothetical protein